MLGISRRTLVYQLEAYGLGRSQARSERSGTEIPLGVLALPSGPVRNKKSINLVYLRPGARGQTAGVEPERLGPRAVSTGPE